MLSANRLRRPKNNKILIHDFAIRFRSRSWSSQIGSGPNPSGKNQANFCVAGHCPELSRELLARCVRLISYRVRHFQSRQTYPRNSEASRAIEVGWGRGCRRDFTLCGREPRRQLHRAARQDIQTVHHSPPTRQLVVEPRLQFALRHHAQLEFTKTCPGIENQIDRIDIDNHSAASGRSEALSRCRLFFSDSASDEPPISTW